MRVVCVCVSISSYCARFVAIETSLYRSKDYLENEQTTEERGRREGGREGEMSTPEDRTC